MTATECVRQTAILAGFESRRMLRTWKMAVPAIAMLVITFLAYSNVTSYAEDEVEFITPFVSSASLIAAIYAVINCSQGLSDEFEKRTGLVMLTKPVSRFTIFAGKFLSSYLWGAVLIAVYYLITTALSYAAFGTATPRLLGAFLLTLLYLFAVTGVCNLISSVSPSSSLSMIIAFVLLVVVQIFTTQVAFEHEPWYSLGYESRIIFDYAVDIQTVFDSNMNTNVYEPMMSTAVMIMVLYGAASTALSAWLFRYRNV